MKSLASVSGEFGPEDARQLKAALAHYAAAGEKLEALATRGERIVARMEAGEGSAGGVPPSA